MRLLSPDGLEKLSTEIGNRFDFYALDLILYKITGDHVIHAIAAERDPRWQIARACLLRAEEDGNTVALLGFALAAQHTDTAFREIVIMVLPQAASFQAGIKGAVPDVVTGLNRTIEQLGDPAFRQMIAGSNSRLMDLRRKVTQLDVYKLFHDSLHRLQLERFASLLEAASVICAGAFSEPLYKFHRQLNDAAEAVSAQLSRLSWDDEDRAEQRLWITKLADAANGLQRALDAGDPRLARQSLYDVKRILETRPTAINGRIFSIAETLGLGDLVGMLERLAAASQEAERARIIGEVENLKNLQTVLIGRVREHGLWQDMDDELAQFERHFVRPVRELITEFALDWATVKRRSSTLWSSDPESPWAMQLKLYQRNVDDELAVLERAEEEQAMGDGVELLTAGLMKEFWFFKGAAGHRFYRIDNALKKDCEALLGIDPALAAIITRLNDA